jgi:hypothetical protein
MLRCFAVLLWMLTAFSAIADQAKPPAIVFDSISKDLGRITQGEEGRHVFSFSNKGSGNLEIFSVEPS